MESLNFTLFHGFISEVDRAYRDLRDLTLCYFKHFDPDLFCKLTSKFKRFDNAPSLDGKKHGIVFTCADEEKVTCPDNVIRVAKRFRFDGQNWVDRVANL